MSEITLREYFERLLKEVDYRYTEKFRTIEDDIAKTLAAKEVGKSNIVAIIALFISFLSLLISILMRTYK